MIKKIGLLFVGLLLVGQGCTSVSKNVNISSINNAVDVTEITDTGAGQVEQNSLDDLKNVNDGNEPTEKDNSVDIKDKITDTQTKENKNIKSDMQKIRITTTKGDIVFELYEDTAPKTVANFIKLTNEEFYNGLIFHRREEGFVIQGGDPNGNGTGGPGYKFEDELNDDRTYERGIVAMANSGPNTNGSQFFIMLADVSLPKLYTIFGKVTEGMDVVDKIKIGDKMEKVVIE